ncbi:MAG: BBP7 family outer membrane beta-barrel protein, partial [Planctomycetaceae bacterium]|nr:BBP7 family outer membrane beta-barrel protein [Planctomycetaceae bacterium]
MKYFITTFLALSSSLCFAQGTSTPASLFPQSNADPLPILTAESEVVLQEATGVIIDAEEPLLETTTTGDETTDDTQNSDDNNTVFDSNVAKPKSSRLGFLPRINLDLYERDIKLFDGFRPGNSDQVGRWVRLDYLISWRRGTRIPALATTSSAGTSLEDAGVLGISTTSSLLGTNELNDSTQPGGRIDFGRWIPGTETAIGARFYGLADAGSRLTFTDAIVTRPFFNVDAGEQQSLPV